ncbi:hypothetical protein JCM10449v2_005288 [Rhodotorula kratochvilovae]
MDPSTLPTAPSGKRRKQHKSCRLVRLPEPILFQILSYKDVLTSSNLGLCRALAPVAIKALYRDISLSSREQVQLFAWTLRRHPERAALVLRLTFWDKTYSKDQLCTDAWQPGRGDLGSGQLFDFDSAEPSSGVVVGIGLVKDILRMLVNLGSFHIAGVALFAPLLQRDFLETDPYPRLSVLSLQAIVTAREAVPSSLIHSLTRVPSLKDVLLFGLENLGHSNLLNADPQVRVGPELRILLQALAVGAEKVSICSWWAYPSFMADVTLLPPSVTYLELVVGRGSCITASGNKSSHPATKILEEELAKPSSLLVPDKLANVKWHFPNLVSLVLHGELIPPSTFDILLSLPRLRTLDLGSHLTFLLPTLLDFVRAAPSLHSLHIAVCECIPHSAAVVARKKSRPPPPRPTRRKGFGMEDAKALVRACNEKGVAVGGTIICATKMVYAGDGHLCRGWCQ